MKVCIDPGHGGSDSGGVGINIVGPDNYEKHEVLAIGLTLRTLILEAGIDVLMTRETDQYVSITKRWQMANAWGADLFLSIHTNASGGRGIEVLYGKAKYVNLAKRLAWYIHEITGWPLRRDEGGYYKPSGVGVIKNTSMPALLSESGFIDYPEENAAMDTDIWTAQIAIAHLRFVLEYFGIKNGEEEDMRTFKEMQSRVDLPEKYVYACGELKESDVLCIHAEGPGEGSNKAYGLEFYCVMKGTASPPKRVKEVGGWDNPGWHGGDYGVGDLFPGCGDCRMSIHSPVELAIEIK